MARKSTFRTLVLRGRGVKRPLSPISEEPDSEAYDHPPPTKVPKYHTPPTLVLRGKGIKKPRSEVGNIKPSHIAPPCESAQESTHDPFHHLSPTIQDELITAERQLEECINRNKRDQEIAQKEEEKKKANIGLIKERLRNVESQERRTKESRSDNQDIGSDRPIQNRESSEAQDQRKRRMIANQDTDHIVWCHNELDVRRSEITRLTGEVKRIEENYKRLEHLLHTQREIKEQLRVSNKTMEHIVEVLLESLKGHQEGAVRVSRRQYR
ncbi:uncharacterized protein IL334_002109 [Kwoniella shivajii]|uniref:Uncharacterized protein n=1 Tax=Kwoniella shivajii TaxID=564305 RepID=A0ABZ1CWU4_9TREE|nr:hypothetical protein IL334_002109 [Kwoniella shivajii]